jgi:hypothetical protein
MHRKLISRRGMFRECVALAVPCAVLRCEAAQNASAVRAEGPARLVKEFKNSYLLDISPDGTKVCLFFTRNPTRSFVIRGTW